jgi:hypothetical protein
VTIILRPSIGDSEFPAFATAADIAARRGVALTDTQEEMAELLVIAATAVITDAAGKTDAWAAALDPVPGMLRFLCIEVAARAMANPDGLRSLGEQLGAYQSSMSYRDVAAGGGLMLTTVEQLLVSRVVHGRTSGSARARSVVNDLLDDECGS